MTPGRISLVMEDGTIEEVATDPEVAERARYLADNLIKRKDGPDKGRATPTT